jgi:hypothetical protein
MLSRQHGAGLSNSSTAGYIAGGNDNAGNFTTTYIKIT